MDVVGCGRSLRECGQSLGEATEAYGEKARLQGDSVKLARVQRKLSALPSKLLSALPSLAGLLVTWPSPKLRPRTLDGSERIFEALKRLVPEVIGTWKKLTLLEKNLSGGSWRIIFVDGYMEYLSPKECSVLKEWWLTRLCKGHAPGGVA